MRSEVIGCRQPELSTLWASVSSEGTDRTVVRQRVTEVMRQLVDTLEELEAEVTREAVRRARERAQVMAEASGFTTVVPLEVADTGLLGDGDRRPPQPPAFGGARVQAVAGAGAGEGYDITPREVEARITVEARFRAE
ncbi:SIMPL domain-containing protein [Kytococcus sp. Marseille-QA3725]